MGKLGIRKKIFGMQSDKKINLKNYHPKKYFAFLRKLANILTRIYNQKKGKSLYIKNKNSDLIFDPVTTFDKLFEKQIRNEIKKKFKDYSILGEEYGYQKNKDINHSWVIDPIDGTKSFIAGNPTWSNLVGLDVNNKPLYGLANFPELNKYYINSDKKSFLYNKNKKIILKVSKTKNFEKIKIAGSTNCFLRYMKKKHIKKVIKLIQFNSFDSLTIGNFCEGKIDAVIGCGNKSWDIHPWMPIIQNSGGLITNWYGKAVDTGGNVLIANNKKNHSKILRIINKIL